MSDWAATVSELATGGGTLVLAIATFAAVRSANRSAQVAQAAMQAAMRPVLMQSRLDDAPQKIAFGDDRWITVPGGCAALEADGAVYLAISVRNAGTGMAIIHGWHVQAGRPGADDPAPPLDAFTPQSRDMYVGPGDVGFWQGALRDPARPQFGELAAAVKDRDLILVDVLYGDYEGGQRVITRFTVRWREPAGDDAQRRGVPRPDGRWLASVVRHWNVDRPDPR